jgi:hypothetical protein
MENNDEIPSLNKRNAVYINLNGIRSNEKNISKYHSDEKNILEVIDYGSVCFLIDIYNFFNDAKKLTQNIPICEKKRSNRMYELIKFYLLYTDLEIIIIGTSHGTLIIHGVILKLKMIVDENLQKQLNSNRIFIVTHNSPRNFKKELLENQQIYHIFNVDDKLLLNMYGKFKKNVIIPNLSIQFKGLKECNVEDKFKIFINYLAQIQRFYLKFENFNQKGYFIYHTTYYNLLPLFNCNQIPKVVDDFFYKKINNDVKIFDRKLFLIGDLLSKKFDKNEKINEILKLVSHDLSLLDDKDIFQLYYNINKDIKIDINICEKEQKKFKYVKKRNYSQTINFNFDKKDNSILLSYNQLKSILRDKDTDNIKDGFFFIKKYQDMIEKLNTHTIFNNDEKNKILLFLCKFDRNTFIKVLIINNEILSKLDDDIIASIYISLNKIIYENLKNL